MNFSIINSFIEQNPKLVVLTGAGISAASGIPTYRDHNGCWLRTNPIKHQEFLEQAYQRQRYWTRSILGWDTINNAQPNQAHLALCQLEKAGRVSLLVTQNVDGLHQQAGNLNVVDLHGRLDKVICLSCNHHIEREKLQHQLLKDNPHLINIHTTMSADGDAHAEQYLVEATKTPNCQLCSGILMPDVIFFGGSVPKVRVNKVTEALNNSDALLVIGSSLAQYSGFRYCKQAQKANKAIAIINEGTTRADSIADIKIESDCGEVLSWITTHLQSTTHDFNG